MASFRHMGTAAADAYPAVKFTCTAFGWYSEYGQYPACTGEMRPGSLSASTR